MASAVLLQGLTAHYLVRDSYPLQPCEIALVHAASGGVGMLLTQMIRMIGARVIGLTTKEWKRNRVSEAGADEVMLYSEPWVERARKLHIDVVFDSIGSTLQQSLHVVRTGGSVVFYGMAGGGPPLVDANYLMDHSKAVIGGDLWNVLTSREIRLQRSTELFQWITNGQVRVPIAARFSLSEGAEAHRLLESGQHVGKILLIP
jgi:NADPH2:quinone reductase